MVFLRRICSSRPGDGEQREQSLASLTACGKGLTAFNPSHVSLSCVKTNSVSFASVHARKLNHSVCFSFPLEVDYFVGTPFIARRCVSKQIGRHDAACQDCPRGVSRSPEAHCFWVVARTVRFSQPAVLSTLLVIQLFGSVFPPPNSSRKHRKERCGHFRSQRSFITLSWCALEYSVVGRISCHVPYDSIRTNVCQ